MREAYTPDVIEEDKLRFDPFAEGRRRRTSIIHMLSLVFTTVLLGGIYLYGSPNSFVRRVLLPEETVVGNLIQIIIVLFGTWVLVFAVGRIRSFRREAAVIRDGRVHAAMARSRTPSEAIDALSSLPPNFKSITYYRLLRIIEQRREHGGDFQQLYRTCQDRWTLEKERLASEYSTSDVLIWSMPILGFIGTVIGISQAVGNFSAFLGVSGSDIEIGLIKERLSDVASGLAFAFDTTLLGLVSSLVGMLAVSWANAHESDFQSRLDVLSLELVGSQPTEPEVLESSR